MLESAFQTDRQTDRQTEIELKRSWLLGVPPKGLEARAFTFGGTQRVQVQCWEEGNGSMLGSMVGLILDKV